MSAMQIKNKLLHEFLLDAIAVIKRIAYSEDSSLAIKFLDDNWHEMRNFEKVLMKGRLESGSGEILKECGESEL